MRSEALFDRQLDRAHGFGGQPGSGDVLGGVRVVELVGCRPAKSLGVDQLETSTVPRRQAERGARRKLVTEASIVVEARADVGVDPAVGREGLLQIRSHQRIDAGVVVVDWRNGSRDAVAHDELRARAPQA